MKGRVFGALTGFAFLAAVLSIAFGSTELDWSALLRGETGNTARLVLLYVRLPRTLGAIVCGASLAAAGAILQTLLNNSLAGPNIIGVNAGANFAALLVMALFPQQVHLVPPAAFAGALGCTVLIWCAADLTGASRTTILLAGAAISGIIGAASSAVKILFPDVLYSYNLFAVGSLSGLTMRKVLSAAPYAAAGLAAALLLQRDMNVLTLGDDLAQAVGLHLRRTRRMLIFTAALLAGAAVSIAGTIGFVGLLVPHAARWLLGSDRRGFVPAAAMLGAGLVLLCDVFGRVVFAPFEMPVGLLLSLLGGAYFLVLLLRTKGGRTYD